MQNIRNLDTKHNTIIVEDTYLLRERIGGGSFGQLYSALHIKNKTMMALKLEQKVSSKNPTLAREAGILAEFSNFKGFPKFGGYGTEQSFNYIILNLLGLNLEKLLKVCNRSFSLHTTLMIADQLLSRIEIMHSKGFLHRDIKPENFCMGLGGESDTLYLIDFGLARSYREPNGDHIPFKENKGLVGTARFASLNTHRGFEQGRRDDLESICYALIYFMKGELPWQSIKVVDKHEKYKLIAEMKMSLSTKEICEGLPEEFLIYLKIM